MAQQIPLALLLFAVGRLGVGRMGESACGSPCRSPATGSWVYSGAHARGPQSWRVTDAGVQAHDVPWAAIPTMGEAWHNNHHAFPGSARIGPLSRPERLGLSLLSDCFERLGWAWDIRIARLTCRRAHLFGRVEA